MPIPDYQSIMLPLLMLVEKHGALSRKEAARLLSDQFNLSEQERRQLIPSGRLTIIQSRAGWAQTHLKKAGLLSYLQRGTMTITDRGRAILSKNLKIINLDYLRQFPEWVEFSESYKNSHKKHLTSEKNLENPEELLGETYCQLKNQILSEILEKIQTCSPQFFEKLVLDVMLKMGYGGSRKDAGRALGQAGDEGIDGIINEDRLGLDLIYLQAKRWEAVVGRPEVQKFAGALQGKRARKGIFMTTSDFSSEAYKYVETIDPKIVLISGKKLAEFMWEYNVGLNNLINYEVKKIDLDYFIE